MDIKLKQRIVGAVVLVALAVIFIPMIFNDTGVFQEELSMSAKIPRPPAKPNTQTVITLNAEGVSESHESVTSPNPEQIITRSEALQSKAVNKKNHILAKKTSAEAKPNAQKAIKAQAAWVIQVVNLSNEANAKLLVQQLRGQGFTAFLRKTSSGKNKGTVRVFIGPIVKRDKAVALQAQLDKVAHIKGTIIPFEPSTS